MELGFTHRFAEPKLPGSELLIVKVENEDYWLMKTVFENGDNTKWSKIGKVELKHTILMLHLGLTEAEANAIIER